MCFVRVWKYTAIIAINIINRLRFVPQQNRVYCAGRTISNLWRLISFQEGRAINQKVSPGLLPRRPGIDREPGRVIFMVDKIIFRQVFLRVLRSSRSVSVSQCCIFTLDVILLLLKRQAREVWEPSNMAMFLRISGTIKKKCFRFFLFLF